MTEKAEELAALRRAIDLRPLVTACPACKADNPGDVVTKGNLWHCWRCQDGGDVFAYLMKRDGISFTESVELVKEMLHG